MATPLPSLHLTDEEEAVGTVSEVFYDAGLHQLKLSLCLIDMVITTKEFNVPAFGAIVILSWKLKKGCEFRQLDNNVFVFQFFHADDKHFIQKEGPWCFDDQL